MVLTEVREAHADVPGVGLVGGAVLDDHRVQQALAAHLLHDGRAQSAQLAAEALSLSTQKGSISGQIRLQS